MFGRSKWLFFRQVVPSQKIFYFAVKILLSAATKCTLSITKQLAIPIPHQKGKIFALLQYKIQVLYLWAFHQIKLVSHIEASEWL